MKALFLCNTPYQLIVITQLCQTLLTDYDIDIIISDQIADTDSLIKRVKKADYFKNVFLYKPKEKFFKKPRCKYYFEYIKQLVFGKYFWDKDMVIKDDYDEFYFVTPCFEANMIARCIKNNNLKIFMYEDGFASYTEFYGNLLKKLYIKDYLYLYRRLFYSELYKVKGIYAFNFKYMQWKGRFPVYKIEKISEDHIALINRIFDYNSMKDKYDKKIIFFEESYYADGIDIDDEKLINELADNIGKEKIMIKIHPRNPSNRFLKTGIKTNTNTSIPWEVIALNINIEEKILITIASGSALTSMLNTSIVPRKIIMLMECKEIEKRGLTPAASLLKKIAGNNSFHVVLPRDINEAKKIVNSLLKERGGLNEL